MKFPTLVINYNFAAEYQTFKIQRPSIRNWNKWLSFFWIIYIIVVLAATYYILLKWFKKVLKMVYNTSSRTFHPNPFQRFAIELEDFHTCATYQLCHEQQRQALLDHLHHATDKVKRKFSYLHKLLSNPLSIIQNIYGRLWVTRLLCTCSPGLVVARRSLNDCRRSWYLSLLFSQYMNTRYVSECFDAFSRSHAYLLSTIDRSALKSSCLVFLYLNCS